jgi:hypothetical protein
VLDEQRRIIGDARALNPASVMQAAAARKRRPFLGPTGRLMIVAADHSARGVLAAGDRPMAIANRSELLDRILIALSRPGVDGILGVGRNLLYPPDNDVAGAVDIAVSLL